MVITGYCIERTPARRILSGEQPFPEDPKIQVNLSVQYTSFAAHADRSQIIDFVRKLQPKNIILVHGDVKQMLGLKTALHSSIGTTTSSALNVVCPENCQPVEFTFHRPKMVHILGSLASKVHPIFPGAVAGGGGESGALAPAALSERTHSGIERPLELEEEEEESKMPVLPAPSNYVSITAVLVRDRQEHLLVAPEELEEYTEFRSVKVQQRQYIEFPYSLEHLRDFLISSATVDALELIHEGTTRRRYLAVLGGAIKIFHNGQILTIEWQTSPEVDLVADAVALCAYQVVQMPATRLQELVNAKHDRDESSAKGFKTLSKLLAEKYFVEELDPTKEIVKIRVRTAKAHASITATVHWASGIVHCEDECLLEQLQRDLDCVKMLVS